jgi:hypothetical protein
MALLFRLGNWGPSHSLLCLLRWHRFER